MKTGFSYEYYQEDIARFIDYYTSKILEINEGLKELKANGKIGDDIIIEGRIKSYKSLLGNYKDGKNIEDCFGLKIITNSKKEIGQIEDNIIKEIFEAKRIKNHFLIPTTKYNAKHIIVWPKNIKENFTLIEIQLCTKDEERKNNEGATAHDIYKLGTKIAVEQQHTLLMDLDPEKRKQYLPIYYIVDEDELKILDEKSTIRKMYPTIYGNAKEKLIPVEKSFKDSVRVEIDKMAEKWENKTEQEENKENTNIERENKDLFKEEI